MNLSTILIRGDKMDNKDIVSKVREFNRFYMPKMNLLGIII